MHGVPRLAACAILYNDMQLGMHATPLADEDPVAARPVGLRMGLVVSRA